MRMWSENLVALVQFFAPSNLVLTFDESCSCAARTDGVKVLNDVEELLSRNEKGEISGLSFPDRIIVTANHQIYADWVYIWCIAYLAGAHGAGMQFFDFVFLKRKLALDKENILNNLTRSKKSGNPLWLILFPEGTGCTRKKSQEYAAKNNIKDNRFTLLPRSTGLRLCTLALDDSVEWLYDFTIGYSGIHADVNPEDVYTISKIFFLGQNPKKIHVHIRRYRVADIPKDAEAFAQWVHQRWVEKDAFMSQFYKEGRFISPDNEQERMAYNSRTFEIPIKLNSSLLELAQPYVFLLSYIPLMKMVQTLFHSLSSR
ncbi:hypothetical protein EC973_000821 [Apophysomyces ossiformis]|uniref:Phospholipid/glycerol acyltransferase domain-containing protein n=1 Tax=Apophysomyces ossiformis TaxID=679940 RepID=A0A8H7BUK0_9FUNG|nr:hypothetical protein EC973_000821 [Apophysomyces ossiformis]